MKTVAKLRLEEFFSEPLNFRNEKKKATTIRCGEGYFLALFASEGVMASHIIELSEKAFYPKRVILEDWFLDKEMENDILTLEDKKEYDRCMRGMFKHLKKLQLDIREKGVFHLFYEQFSQRGKIEFAGEQMEVFGFLDSYVNWRNNIFMLPLD